MEYKYDVHIFLVLLHGDWQVRKSGQSQCRALRKNKNSNKKKEKKTPKKVPENRNGKPTKQQK